MTAAAARGDTHLSVEDTTGLASGQMVTLVLVDDGSGMLGKELHNQQASSGDCAYQVPLRLEWPVRLEAVAQGEVTLAQPLRTDLSLPWSPAIHAMDSLTEVGVEHLRISFFPVPYAGHLKEPGYNAIFFEQGVADGWVRDVTIEDGDNGVLTDTLVKHMTFRDVTVRGREGHHGMNLATSADLLVERMTLENDWIHGVTVDHRTSGVVFSRLSSPLSIALDHHRDSPFENLYTEITAYNFFSGGNNCAGPHAGARNTYWNLASPMPPPYLWGSIQSNAIGDLTIDDVLTEDNEWFENVEALDPPNLYEAQLGARMCQASFDACNRAVWSRETGQCEPSPRPDGTACDDGNAATKNDGCQAGVCVAEAVTTVSASSGQGGAGGCGEGCELAAVAGAGGADATSRTETGCQLGRGARPSWSPLVALFLLGRRRRVRCRA